MSAQPKWLLAAVLAPIACAHSLGPELYSGLRWRMIDRKSTRLNSSHLGISYAVFGKASQIFVNHGAYMTCYVAHPIVGDLSG